MKFKSLIETTHCLPTRLFHLDL